MNNGTQCGMGFTSVLTVIFIVLKLCKVITWSWWWVCPPSGLVGDQGLFYLYSF